MSKKHKTKSIDENVYILRDDYTYHIIKNSDADIIKASRDLKTKYILFPVNGITGTKYLLDKRENVFMISNISLHIDADIGFVLYGDDIADVNGYNHIELKADNIYEYYSLLGSLYNIEICSEMLDMSTASSIEIRPALINFVVDININGDRYQLNPEVYRTVVPTDDFSILNSLDGTILLVDDLIKYIEHTVVGKDEYENVIDSYRSFMLFNDGTYSRLRYGARNKNYQIKSIHLPKTGKIDDAKLCSSIVLLDSDSALYAAVTYEEFDALKSDETYTFSYVMYNIEVNTALNSIPDEELTVDVVLELDGADYYVQWEDVVMFTTINQVAFVMVSMQDVSLVLNEALPWYDEGFTSLCYTWSITKAKDKLHKFVLQESATDKLICRDHYDILSKMVSNVRSHNFMEVSNGRN